MTFFTESLNTLYENTKFFGKIEKNLKKTGIIVPVLTIKIIENNRKGNILCVEL